MGWFGYTGKILNVDLSENKLEILEANPEVYDKYMGGAGYAVHVIHQELKKIKSPEDESNIMVFAVGPLTIDGIPNGGRVTVGSISPETGVWGETHIGTRFAIEMKKAGFDAIIVRGKAEKPVYLYLNDGKAEIRDASRYWGKDIHETINSLRSDLNDPTVKALAIGPAGEKKVKISIIANEEGFGGRCGLGAVMGSKNLKAIVAKGTQKIPVAHPEELKEFLKDLVKKLTKGGTGLRNYGSAGGVKAYHALGNLPIRNFLWGKWDDEKVAKISGDTMTEKYLKSPFACTLCPIACKRLVEVKNGKYFKEFTGLGPEYETVGLLGSNLLVDDLEAIIKANNICDRLGLDTISAGNVIGFLFDAAEKGIIDKNIEGLNLEWGDAETVHKLLEKIAYREGVGDILAEGVRKAAQKLGAPELTVEIKGLEMPAHDGRAYWSHGLSHATMNRGADHLGWPHMPFKGVSVPELGITAFENRYIDGDELIETVIKMQNLMIIYDSLILCKYAFAAGLTVTDIIKLLYFVTGKEYTPEKLMEIGNRIWKTQRKINNELGLTSKDDKLPPRMASPHANRDDTKVPPVEKWLPRYYELRGINPDGTVGKID